MIKTNTKVQQQKETKKRSILWLHFIKMETSILLLYFINLSHA